ncbi:MAG: MerR family transcriptional regulator [bacterium]|nr:MerR family transcriptional regulator [bacterium]
MEANYPMKTVAKKTGLSPHVIRIWERRYGAVQPTRTPTNRRVYSEQDVEKLRLLGRLTQSGLSIGEIANRDLKELQKMVNETLVPRPGKNPLAQKYLQQCLDKISHLDEAGLEQTLNRAALELSQRHFLEQLISPLVNEVGCLWENGTFRVAHEHFVTAFLGSYLRATRASFAENVNGPTVVVGTPAGQLHEIGAMLAAKTAQAEGWNVLYLGPNLPAEDLAAAVHKSGAKVLALSTVYPGDDPGFAGEVERLKQLLPPAVKVVYGGHSAEAYEDTIQENGAYRVEDLGEFRQYLQQARNEMI